jgi:membrane-associated protease RseP (regulator of RpoE activity)
MTREGRRIVLQVVLFILTFITSTLAGAEWAYSKSILSGNYSWSDFVSGMSYSVPFLLYLTVHEFGHYFTAIYHKVKTSLPYYIPIPFSIGTLGAFIRLRARPASNIQQFDIGIAGPLAGFVVAVILLIYGFSTLPPAEYIFQFHPEYKQFGADYAKYVYAPEFLKGKNIVDFTIGKNLIFLLAEQFVDDRRASRTRMS